MGTWLPGVPYTDGTEDQITAEINTDRDNGTAVTNGQPKNPNGVAVRPPQTAYDAWLAKVAAQVANPTPATPLRILVIGNSISGILRPAISDAKPWPAELDILGIAASGDDGWRFALGDSDVRNMLSTTGSTTSSSTGGWGVSLAAGQNAVQGMLAKYLHVVWSRTPSGGTIQVREGSAGGTIIATIDTAGTAKSGNVTEVTLNANFNGQYLGNIYFVASGGTCVLDGLSVRGPTSCAVVVSGAHAGYTSANHSGLPSRALDYVEQSHPDVVIIMHGTNDGPANIDARLRALVDEVQARTSNLVVLVGEPLTALGNTMTAAMSDIVRQIADDKGCLHIDVPAAMPSFDTYHSGDLLHPSQSGHRAIAALIGSVLRGDPIGGAFGHAARANAFTPTTAARWPYAQMTKDVALDHLSTVCAPVLNLQVLAAGTTWSSSGVADGKAYYRIPASLNGRNLVAVGLAVFAPSTSGTPTVQIARGRQASATAAHSFVDMLSTRITIDANEYDSRNAATPAVINASNAGVQTGDLIRVDLDVTGTNTAGMFLTLEFA